jgi:hypothetical protein
MVDIKRKCLLLIIVVISWSGSVSAGPSMIEISKCFGKKDPAINYSANIFLNDVDDDGIKELIIQTKQKFYIYRINIAKKDIELMQKLTVPISAPGDNYFLFCFGTPDLKTGKTLLILSSRGLYFYPKTKEGFAECPVKIYDGCKSLKLAYSDFIFKHYMFSIDLDEDGTDEIILPDKTNFKILKRTESKYKEISMPETSNRKRSRFSVKDSIYFYNRHYQHFFFIPNPCGKGKSLVFYNKIFNGEDNITSFRIFHPVNPISYKKEADQVLSIKEYPIMTMIEDGLVDFFERSPTMDYLNFYQKISYFKSEKKIQEKKLKAYREFRIKCPNSLIFSRDISGDGYTDLCILNIEYNASSADDIVQVLLGKNIKGRLDFYLFNPGKENYPKTPDYSFNLKSDRETFGSIKLEGDFNGDGERDLLIWTKEDKAKIHLLKSGKPQKKPYTVIKSKDGYDEYMIEKINRDNRDDIITVYRKDKKISIFISGK